MARDFQIFGLNMVQLQFSTAVPLAPGNNNEESNIWDLGLTLDSVNISPNFYHYDVMTDSFGRKVPADVLCDLADCTINFKLVHFDSTPLGIWLSESTAGGNLVNPFIEGVMPAAGTPMGGGIPLYSSGNHYTGLIFGNPDSVTGGTWTFPATYLTGPPVSWPIGTEKSVVECKIRAIPYTPLVSISEGTGPLPNFANASSQGSRLWIYDPPVNV